MQHRLAADMGFALSVTRVKIWVRANRLALLMATVMAVMMAVAFAPVAYAADEDFESFAGAGFAPAPSVGQLDSDEWRVTGLSDGDIDFGATGTSGDFARGLSTGGSGIGGVYAFDTGGNIALGVQPGGSDFTPGTFEYRWTNSSGGTVTALDISYVIWHYNDQGRASSLNFAYAEDCTTFTVVPSLGFTTTVEADPSPLWMAESRNTTLAQLNIGNGSTICLQWIGDDVDGVGAGSRDEYGIDDLSVAPGSPTQVDLLSFTATIGGNEIVLEWETGLEIDNAGFNVLRRRAGQSSYHPVNSTLIAAGAEPGGGALYRFIDRPGEGEFDYLLEDVDTHGTVTRHGPIRVVVVSTNANQPPRAHIPFVVGH